MSIEFKNPDFNSTTDINNRSRYQIDENSRDIFTCSTDTYNKSLTTHINEMKKSKFPASSRNHLIYGNFNKSALIEDQNIQH